MGVVVGEDRAVPVARRTVVAEQPDSGEIGIPRVVGVLGAIVVGVDPEARSACRQEAHCARPLSPLERLEVSEPTIRKWLAEGLLERVEGHKPVEVVQRSVIEFEQVLDTVRESYPVRRWSEALAAFRHDRDLLGQEWAREGAEQHRRHGELARR